MNKKYIKNLLIRVLISIIIFLAIGIFVNQSDSNLLFFKNNFYDKSLKFNKISNLYNKYLGKIINKPNPEKIMNASKELNYIDYNAYMDGAKLNGVSLVYPFKSGIVVFVGEKEIFGNTVIIQGMDGIDYWYGNVDNLNIKLYDYVESDNLIGEAVESTLYVLFMKDNKILNYEDFL